MVGWIKLRKSIKLEKLSIQKINIGIFINKFYTRPSLHNKM